MVRSVEMLGGVLVLGRVATSDVPTRTTDSQMYPPTIRLQAFLAAARARRDDLDEMNMVA